MHPGVAAAVLAATPSPSSTTSTPHGGVDWGNVPAWVGAIATVVGLAAAITGATIAYRQFRQQTEVFRGEVERNKRRDELLDGQLQELQERTQDRTREQAESIRVNWKLDSVPSSVEVTNGSDRPITRVSAAVLSEMPSGDTQTN